MDDTDEAAQIEAWRRQMADEEEEEYARQNSAAAGLPPNTGYSGGDGGSPQRVESSTHGKNGSRVRFQPQPQQRAIPASAAPAATPAASPAGAVASSVDWNANTLRQLEEFQRQNLELQQALKAKDRDFERFKRNAELESLTGGIARPGSSGGGKGDQRDAKIVELAKKNRAMSMQVEREKTKAEKLTGELKRAHQALQSVPGGGTIQSKPAKKKVEPWKLQGGANAAAAEEPLAPTDEVKRMRERLQEASARLGEGSAGWRVTRPTTRHFPYRKSGSLYGEHSAHRPQGFFSECGCCSALFHRGSEGREPNDETRSREGQARTRQGGWGRRRYQKRH